mmetsp:Transcript_111533/g.314941  ORF Transcript_111533/g.314941 Transcript_111533/m.314941 type:complete len:220 (-) Transcript_111533:154-813(-)
MAQAFTPGEKTARSERGFESVQVRWLGGEPVRARLGHPGTAGVEGRRRGGSRAQHRHADVAGRLARGNPARTGVRGRRGPGAPRRHCPRGARAQKQGAKEVVGGRRRGERLQVQYFYQRRHATAAAQCFPGGEDRRVGRRRSGRGQEGCAHGPASCSGGAPQRGCALQDDQRLAGRHKGWPGGGRRRRAHAKGTRHALGSGAPRPRKQQRQGRCRTPQE